MRYLPVNGALECATLCPEASAIGTSHDSMGVSGSVQPGGKSTQPQPVGSPGKSALSPLTTYCDRAVTHDVQAFIENGRKSSATLQRAIDTISDHGSFAVVGNQFLPTAAVVIRRPGIASLQVSGPLIGLQASPRASIINAIGREYVATQNEIADLTRWRAFDAPPRPLRNYSDGGGRPAPVLGKAAETAHQQLEIAATIRAETADVSLGHLEDREATGRADESGLL